MGLQDLLAPFRFVQEDPYRRVRELKASGHQKAVGFLFPDIPEEILHAFGLLSFAIPSVIEHVNHAFACLPTFACPSNVGPLEAALQGRLDFMDGLIIPYSCDAMRAFSQVWESRFPDLFSHTLWLPKRVEGADPRAFFRQELLRMKAALAGFTGSTIADEALLASIKVFNRSRRLLRSLHQQRSRPAPPLSNAEFMSVVRASTCMPREEHSARLEELLAALPERPAQEGLDPRERIRLFLFGSVCEAGEIFQCLDSAGLTVVDDSLYNATRTYHEDALEEGDPVENLVARHFCRAPMSCYHYGKERFAGYLKERIALSAADGVIYLNPKHCEVLQLDYPMVKGVLEAMDVPLLFVETDHTFGSSAPLQTRLEAFAEMILERKGGGI